MSLRAAADQARLEALARARRRHAPAQRDETPVPDPIWSRQPTEAQRDARVRAYEEFMANLPFWSDEALPRIAWRWLLPDDGDPALDDRAWESCRMTERGHVTIALRADASPARIYATTQHELTHACDHELLWLGAPRDVLEARAKHIQHILAEGP